ncbi:MAG: DNA repair protein RadC [Chitinispirillia bacterium]|nr:DNA repair protein RadC [Chitinispirillia bacterium]
MNTGVAEIHDSQTPQLPDHIGHRGRLADKYVRGGIDSFHDYEIIELLLTYVIPRRDTKPLAKSLLARYGTIGAVINAPIEELCTFDGISKRSASLFSLMRDTMTYCLNENCVKKPLITHRKDIEEYLRFTFGYRRIEYIAVIFLDNAYHVISAEVISEGTVTHCNVYPRDIIGRALKCAASYIILAHNHPSGNTEPSEEDWEITERIFAAGRLLDVPLMDHVIISAKRVISLREHMRWPKY